MNRLRKSTYIIYGLGVSYFMLDQLYVQWLQYFYLPASNSGLKPLLSQSKLILAFVLIRLIDAIADPVVGYLSDHTKSKFGKRSLYMLIGGLPLALSMVLFFFPIGDYDSITTLVYLIAIGSLYFISYTFVGGPYNSLIADISANREERINLSTVQSIFRLVFTAFPLIFSAYMISSIAKMTGSMLAGFRWTMIIFSVFACIGVYICSLFLNENKLISNTSKKGTDFRKTVKLLLKKEIIIYFLAFFLFFCGFNMLRNILAYYVVEILKKDIKFVTNVSAILFGVAGVFFPLTNYLTKKFGFTKVIVLNLSAIIIGTLGLILFKNSNISIIYVLCGIIGSGVSGAAFIFPPAMLSELSAKVSRENNISVEGFMFGIQGFFLKLAFTAQSILSIYSISYGSIQGSDTMVTHAGIILGLIIAIILFLGSMILYIINK